MLNQPAQALVISAALVVFGALTGIPSVVSKFPLNLLLLVLPLGLCLTIPVLHSPPGLRPGVAQVLLETASVWTGYAVAFHTHHGFWDGQGIAIGLAGLVLSAPIVFLLARAGFREP